MPSEKVANAIRELIVTAKQKTAELADAAERFIFDYEESANALANKINAHVIACQAAVDTFKTHHETLNGEKADGQGNDRDDQHSRSDARELQREHVKRDSLDDLHRIDGGRPGVGRARTTSTTPRE